MKPLLFFCIILSFFTFSQEESKSELKSRLNLTLSPQYVFMNGMRGDAELRIYKNFGLVTGLMIQSGRMNRGGGFNTDENSKPSINKRIQPDNLNGHSLDFYIKKSRLFQIDDIHIILGIREQRQTIDTQFERFEHREGDLLNEAPVYRFHIVNNRYNVHRYGGFFNLEGKYMIDYTKHLGLHAKLISGFYSQK